MLDKFSIISGTLLLMEWSDFCKYIKENESCSLFAMDENSLVENQY